MKPKTGMGNLILIAVLVAVTATAFFLNLSVCFVLGKQNDVQGVHCIPLQATSSSYRVDATLQ